MIFPPLPRAPLHLGNVVHEVHARLVGLGVCQLEQRRHPEANGVGRGTVTTLKNTPCQWSIHQQDKCCVKRVT